MTDVLANSVPQTPAAGYVGAPASVFIGVVAAAIANLLTSLKGLFGFDDAMDIYACHGVAGMVGLVFTGVFAQCECLALRSTQRSLTSFVLSFCHVQRWLLRHSWRLDGPTLEASWIPVHLDRLLLGMVSCLRCSSVRSTDTPSQDVRRHIRDHVPHQPHPWLPLPCYRGGRNCRHGRGRVWRV